jgi:hypothetical protein
MHSNLPSFLTFPPFRIVRCFVRWARPISPILSRHIVPLGPIPQYLFDSIYTGAVRFLNFKKIANSCHLKLARTRLTRYAHWPLISTSNKIWLHAASNYPKLDACPSSPVSRRMCMETINSAIIAAIRTVEKRTLAERLLRSRDDETRVPSNHFTTGRRRLRGRGTTVGWQRYDIAVGSARMPSKIIRLAEKSLRPVALIRLITETDARDLSKLTWLGSFPYVDVNEPNIGRLE